MTTTTNIYCDESCVENNEAKYMVIGALFIPRIDKKRICKEFVQICEKHKFSTELKWNKVGLKYLDYYKDVINFFVLEKCISFRSVIVEKNKIEYDIYHDNDKELAFYKFYYLLLKKKLENHNDYYIFLDRKPTRDKNRARSLQSFLESHILFNCVNTHIKHFQAYDSAENKLIQLADFFTGLISYSNNFDVDSTPKGLIYKHLEEKLSISTKKSTPFSSTKVNILKWIPKK